MEFRDLKTQYELHKDEIDSAINAVVTSSKFISGPQVKELENKLSEYTGVKHCITCANGTDALQLALMAWNVGEGDAVFVPDFTFFSSGEVVPVMGATPIFVDINKDTFNMDPCSLRKAIEYVKTNTQLTPKVVVAVDLFGQPASFESIVDIAKSENMYVLEDAAQGFGGRIGNKKACSFGDISTTSFFPAKPLGCYGDGGAIFTDNDEWALLIRSYCVHGKGEDKYDNVRIGLNSRLDTLQAAILIEKMSFFDEEVVKCNQVAKLYNEMFEGTDVIVPTVEEDKYSSWAQYTILLPSGDVRKKVMEGLKAAGIPSAVYYVKPMHRQKAFAPYDYEEIDCPNTDDICERCLSLPMSAYLCEDDIKKIANKVLEICSCIK